MNVNITNKIWSSVFTLLTLLVFGGTNIKAGPGDLDPTFSGDGKLLDWLSRGDDTARGVAIQPDGKIVVAGSSWSGLSQDFSVVRYNTDGSLDTTFGTNGKVTTDFNSSHDEAYSIALQADGKIVLAGHSQFIFALVRYNPDGALDTTFGTDGRVTTVFNSGMYGGRAFSVAIHTDGKIVAAGQTGTSLGGGGDFAVARYNPNGSLDSSFDGDGKVTTDIFNLGYDEASSVAIHPNGKIVAAGEGYNSAIGRDVFALVQYNVDGSLDTSFDGDGKVTTQVGSGHSWAKSVAIQPDGRIVAAGKAASGFGLVRYSSNGSLESIVTTENFNDRADSVAIQSDGKIVAAGNSGNGFGVVRLNTNFSFDTTFGDNGTATTPIDSDAGAHGVAIQTDGKIVAAGYSSSIDSVDFAVARYSANGSLDTSFDGDGKVVTDFGFYQGNVLSDTAIQADGKIVAAGGVREDFTVDFAVLRYNRDGSPDATFGSGTGKVRTSMNSNDGARAIAIQPDGKIVVAGAASDHDGNECCFTLARYNVNGALDTTFDGDGIVITGSLGTDAGAYDVAIQPDGKIVAVGFNRAAFAIYRYNSDGSLDTSFGGDGMVTTPIASYIAVAKAVAIQPDGKIVAAGSTWYWSGSASFIVVRYDPNGSLDPTFDGDGIASTVTSQRDEADSCVLQSNGKIIVGGSRSINSNDPGFTLIRYNENGSLDTTFGAGGIVTTNVGLNSAARAVGLQPDGKIIASGTSGRVGDPGDFAVVRYHTDGSLDASFGGGDGIATVDFDNSTDNANGLALDNAGRAVVVGESDGSFALARFHLAPSRASFDFDGDGRSDISVFRPSSAVWYIDRSTEGFSAVQFGVTTDRIVPADYDGDGRTDIAVFRPSTGTWYTLNSASSTITTRFFGVAEDLPAPADYDGDGKADVCVFRPSQGVWYRQNSSNSSFVAVQFGQSGDVPTIGDFDGDGKSDIGVYRPSTSDWYHVRSSDNGMFAERFGQAGDRIAPADYDGDGKMDIAVFRPSTGLWAIRNSSTATYSYYVFGAAGDIPIAGDYDGDGRADIGVWRPSDGTWYIQRSSNSQFIVFPWGLNGDRPTPAAYVN